MRITTFVFGYLIQVFVLRGQDSSSIGHSYSKNSIVLEVGGTGLMYSVGFERTILTRPFTSHGIKCSISKPFIQGLTRLFLPIEYNLYLGRKKCKLLAGAGTITLISTSPSPQGISSQRDYKKLYFENPSLAVNKYNTVRYEPLLDVAFTGKIGLYRVGKKVDSFLYLNCFYIRMGLEYHFQPIWVGAGFHFKL